jgi:hypothetical protein
MRFIIEVSDQTRSVKPIQKHLFKKFMPKQKLDYIDIGKKPVEIWCRHVRREIEALEIKDKFVVFGLADMLPIQAIKTPIVPEAIDRMELGWGARYGKEGLSEYGAYHFLYGKETPYKNSCQFSIWNTKALLRELERIDGSPWDFETAPTKTRAACLKKASFRYIEESAISKRRPGLVNLCGLREREIEEIIEMGLVKRSSIIYGWNGTNQRTKESYGKKYAEFF